MIKQIALLVLCLAVTVEAAPEPFSLLWPADASTVTTTPTLQWEVKGDVDHYEVWIDGTAVETLLAPPDGHRCRYPSMALNKGSHQWYIVAVDTQSVTRRSQNTFTVTVQDQSHYDVVVYGATSSGVVAAVQAIKMGKQAVLIGGYPNHGRLGGLSSGGLGATDSGDKSVIGGLSREFYNRLGREYGSSSSKWTFEPHVALKVFDDFINEYSVPVVYHERLNRSGSGVQKSGAQITGITMKSGRQFTGSMFIDATYEGDLMAEAGVSYTTGREANSVYGEKYNGIQAGRNSNQLPSGIDPYVIKGNPGSGLLPGVNPDAGGANGAGDNKIQAYNFRMCLTNNATNRVMIAQPAGYNQDDYEILFRAIEDGGQTSNFFKLSAMPNKKTDSNNTGGISTDYIGWNHSYPEADYATREQIVSAHEKYQKGLVWTLQNHSRVPQSIRKFYAPWGLPLDEFLENGHWTPQLYIRESRRMVSDFVMTDRHLRRLSQIDDPIGMGSYNMDSHNVQRYVDASGFVRDEGDVQIGIQPYGISYGSIIPKASEVTNLLVPVCVSSSHMAYGSIRMEPVFMILGQSASTAAVLAINNNVNVQKLDYRILANQLRSDGQVLPLVTKDQRLRPSTIRAPAQEL